MEFIKQEPYDGPTGLAPPLLIEVPLGFERDEWDKLTEGYNCEEDEVGDTIATRGQVGSRKGRPTNLKVPYKGELSSSSRAVAQRDRAALLDAETKALENANAADRAARYQLRKKIEGADNYKSESIAGRKKMLAAAQEELSEKRFRSCKSAEWLQTNLDRIHKKWAHAYHEVDLRKHSKALEKASTTNSNSANTSKSRTHLRIYGPGGALEKIMRTTYSDGLAKLKSNSFESKEAKKEWQEFVGSLTPDELGIVTAQHWEPIEPESVFDTLGYSDDTVLRGDKPYYRGNDSDECEEEADIDAEIDDFYNRCENEYETEEQWEEVQAAASDDEYSSTTDFEGFSDDDVAA